MSAKVIHGDCLDVMRGMPDASVGAVVTDPPYDLTANKRGGTGVASVNLDSPYGRSRIGTGNGAGGFMGKSWDATGIAFSVELWAECLRVLKPGGHVLTFGGTRTFHRMATAVEDAGFEIRDSIAWLYGSGFPKSLNLVDDDGDRTGWGTALKPAFEPIVVGRKPLIGTVAANVLAHGTGALNVDGCRICPEDMTGWHRDARDEHVLSHGPAALTREGEESAHRRYTERGGTNFAATPGPRGGSPDGRWPANVILDEDQAAALDEQSGVTRSSAQPRRNTAAAHNLTASMGRSVADWTTSGHDDAGGASRFFYVAKAPKAERVRTEEVAHPTVKPLTLMRWLVRLVTPPGGTVLEPFAGSGTTVEACLMEGFDCIAIEREADYLPLIQQRIDRVPVAEPDLFTGEPA